MNNRTISDVIKYLGIVAPVKITFHKQVTVGTSLCDGSYQRCKQHHKIKIRKKAARGNFETVCHELIHAWQDEKAPKSKDHGLLFKRKAKELEARYLLTGVYLKGRDR
jgi:hypothetical protein